MSAIALALIVVSAVLVRGAVIGLSPADSFTDIFQRSTGGAGITPTLPIPQGTPGAVTGGNQPNFPANVERWRGLVSAHFPPGIVNQALSVMEGESQGNPNATNPTSRAAGLFQHMPQYWAERSRAAGVPGANIYDPTANVRVAGWLYKQSGTWNHWSSKPKVA